MLQKSHLRQGSCLALFLTALTLSAWATEHRVTSADGTLALTVSDARGLSHRLEVNGQTLLQPSRLGLEFAGGVKLGPAATIRTAKAAKHDGTWDNRFGKRRVVRDRWNEIRLALEEPGTPARRFGLIARAYDDGVAFRYELPRASKLGEFTLTRELTEFVFGGDYRCWAGEPSDCAENNYPETTLSRIPQYSTDTNGTRRSYLSTLPLTVQTPMACIAVAESDLLDWAGMFVTGALRLRQAAQRPPAGLGPRLRFASLRHRQGLRLLRKARRRRLED
jgi:alpha-glucosidase